jgi:uncharacterized protein involved in type VI secretion and phage assembly
MPIDLLDAMGHARSSRGYGGLFYGVYAAVVTEIVDPDGQGRVRIRLPWSPDPAGKAYEAWARLGTFMAGNNRGGWFIPDPGDEVLVAFEAGDPRHPYVLGGLWNGQDSPPEAMDGAGRNEKKTLRSRNGVVVTLDDADGRESLTLTTPAGQSVKLSDGPGVIEVRDGNGNSVELAGSGITVVAGAKVTVQAAQVEISAGTVSVSAGMSRFSGVVQADTVITNSVVSASYTPGAGNIW